LEREEEEARNAAGGLSSSLEQSLEEKLRLIHEEVKAKGMVSDARLDEMMCKSTHCLTDLVCVLGTTRIGNTSIRLYKELSLGGLRDDAKVAQPKGEPPSTMEGKTKGPKPLASQNSD